MQYKKLLTFGAAESAARACNWLVLAILPLILPAAEYGEVGLIVAAEALLMSVIMVGHDRAVMRFHLTDPELNVYQNAFFVPSAVGLLVVIIAIVLGLGGLVVLGIPAWPHFFLLALCVVGLAAQKVMLARATADGDLGVYVVLRTVRSVVKLVLAIALTIIWPTSLSYLYALVIAILVAAVATAVRSLPAFKVKWSVSAGSVRRIFAFGWPFVFHVVSGNILVASDRFFLEYFEDTAVVGLYTLAYTVGFSILFVYAAISTYMQPQVYRFSADSAAAERMLAHYTFICLVAALGVASIAIVGFYALAPRLLGTDYSGTGEIIPLVIAAYLLHPAYNQGIYRLTIHQRTKIIAMSSGAAALLNIVLNLVLIPPFGAIGAAIATVISYAALAVVTLAASVVLTDSKWSDVQLRSVIAASFVVAGALSFVAQGLFAVPVLLFSAVVIVIANRERSTRYLRLARRIYSA